MSARPVIANEMQLVHILRVTAVRLRDAEQIGCQGERERMAAAVLDAVHIITHRTSENDA